MTDNGGWSRYRKISKLGQGGFGAAFLVESRADVSKKFVIKEVILRTTDKKAADDARKEAAFLAQLKHPNIVSYVESFTVPPRGIGNGGTLCIVMEYADDGDLGGRVEAAKKGTNPLSECEALNLFVQIALALKHVHARRILHRDLKSQNVFLTKAGIVKVGDFGIAKTLASSLDMARTQIGTPYYLSPEICCDKPYNKKSDVWALGVILYELLALSLPFTAPSLPALVTRILTTSPPPLPAKVSPEARALVAQLLQRDPKARPSVNAILKTDLLQKRIELFLTQTITGREFGVSIGAIFFIILAQRRT
jgi:NIMA (never in mitosis gene a)-related kinase